MAALASYCDARTQRGEWLLRIEDVDEPRARVDAETSILRTLARYGFVWDGPVLRQSARAAIYQQTLDRLIRERRAYPCACARSELVTAPMGAGGERIYPGTCRTGLAGERAARTRRAWRLLVDDTTIEYTDRLQGAQAQSLAGDVGDFIVKRSDGLFAYQLAVVVDDAAQDVTDVVRGADLLASTPRQIHLQRVLGVPTPAYLHVPVAITAAGDKLSKQTDAPPLPDDATLALVAAWQFLEQPAARMPPRDVAAFWQHALSNWTPARLPPVPMLPAPPRFGG